MTVSGVAGLCWRQRKPGNVHQFSAPATLMLETAASRRGMSGQSNLQDSLSVETSVGARPLWRYLLWLRRGSPRPTLPASSPPGRPDCVAVVAWRSAPRSCLARFEPACRRPPRPIQRECLQLPRASLDHPFVELFIPAVLDKASAQSLSEVFNSAAHSVKRGHCSLLPLPGSVGAEAVIKIVCYHRLRCPFPGVRRLHRRL